MKYIVALLVIILLTVPAAALRHPSYPWCGWFMRGYVADHFGIHLGSEYNVARNWAHFGTPVPMGPNTIGVKPHHVVYVLRKVDANHFLAISGNDGHAVRIRERSTRGFIAFRAVPGGMGTGLPVIAGGPEEGEWRVDHGRYPRRHHRG